MCKTAVADRSKWSLGDPIPSKRTFVHLPEESAAPVPSRNDAHTWPNSLGTSDIRREAANGFYADGRKRYDACPVSEIPFEVCPGATCPGHCRPFWRNVFRVEVKKLAACDVGDGVPVVAHPPVWCPRETCDKCHSKACWPDQEFYQKTMRGKGGRYSK